MCLIKITLGKKHLVWIEKKSAQEKNKQTNKQTAKYVWARFALKLSQLNLRIGSNFYDINIFLPIL